MEIKEYLDRMLNIQNSLIEFIDNDENDEEKYQNLVSLLENFKFRYDKHDFKLFIHLLSVIVNHHLHGKYFYDKIQQILNFSKERIKKNFTNFEIFRTFQENKRIILYLIKEDILKLDNFIIMKMSDDEYGYMKYDQYFKPEIDQTNSEADTNGKSEQIIDEDFEVRRKSGENDNYLLHLIRNDMINEFSSAFNRENFNLNDQINQSIFESNITLITNKPSYIEYAAYFGSFEIFKFCSVKGAKITPSIWKYAIHGRNKEIIKFLVDKKIESKKKEILEESIKCHHNEITEFIINNLLDKKDQYQYDDDLYTCSICYFNFTFFPKNFLEKKYLYYLCDGDYFNLVEICLRTMQIDIDQLMKYAKEVEKAEIYNLLSCYKPQNSLSTDHEVNDEIFTIWEQTDKGTVELTKKASKKLSSSNNPCIVLFFGDLRIGKSTLASHIISGPSSDILKTIFKTAGSSIACTHNINAYGPIKCVDFAKSYGIQREDIKNKNWNRDIFIIDSEGLNSLLTSETSWLKQALLAMLPINSLTFYVANSTNKANLDQFMKYLKLVRIIGKMEIHHGFGYINNQEKFDGIDITKKVLEQNQLITIKMIDEFSKSFDLIDDSHFRAFSTLCFERHRNEYFSSLSEIVKFIIKICLYEGTTVSGDMVVSMLNEMIQKTSKIKNLKDPDIDFSKIFIQVLHDSIKHSITEQIPLIHKKILGELKKLSIFKVIYFFDEKDFKEQIEKNDFVNEFISQAAAKILPNIPESFPFLIDSLKNDVLKIIKKQIPIQRDNYIKSTKSLIKYVSAGVLATGGLLFFCT